MERRFMAGEFGKPGMGLGKAVLKIGSGQLGPLQSWLGTWCSAWAFGTCDKASRNGERAVLRIFFGNGEMSLFDVDDRKASSFIRFFGEGHYLSGY